MFSQRFQEVLDARGWGAFPNALQGIDEENLARGGLEELAHRLDFKLLQFFLIGIRIFERVTNRLPEGGYVIHVGNIQLQTRIDFGLGGGKKSANHIC